MGVLNRPSHIINAKHKNKSQRLTFCFMRIEIENYISLNINFKHNCLNFYFQCNPLKVIIENILSCEL